MQAFIFLLFQSLLVQIIWRNEPKCCCCSSSSSAGHVGTSTSVRCQTCIKLSRKFLEVNKELSCCLSRGLTAAALVQWCAEVWSLTAVLLKHNMVTSFGIGMAALPMEERTQRFTCTLNIHALTGLLMNWQVGLVMYPRSNNSTRARITIFITLYPTTMKISYGPFKPLRAHWLCHSNWADLMSHHRQALRSNNKLCFAQIFWAQRTKTR